MTKEIYTVPDIGMILANFIHIMKLSTAPFESFVTIDETNTFSYV